MALKVEDYYPDQGKCNASSLQDDVKIILTITPWDRGGDTSPEYKRIEGTVEEVVKYLLLLGNYGGAESVDDLEDEDEVEEFNEDFNVFVANNAPHKIIDAIIITINGDDGYEVTYL